MAMKNPLMHGIWARWDEPIEQKTKFKNDFHWYSVQYFDVRIIHFAHCPPQKLKKNNTQSFSTCIIDIIIRMYKIKMKKKENNKYNLPVFLSIG